jgi:trehalose 2-sulfotransferase
MQKQSSHNSILNRKIDFNPSGLWSRTIALCFSPRSGSNLIARHMWRAGVMGAPSEYLNYDAIMLESAAAFGAKTLHDYMEKLAAVRTSPNGVFSMKLLPGHWEMMRMSRCHQILKNADVVLAARKDIVAQAVSMHIAETSGSWTDEIPARSDVEVSYEFEKILGHLRYIEEINEFWAKTLSGRNKPVILGVYEHISGNPESFIQTISRTLRIPLDSAREVEHVRIVTRQATSRNDDWAGRFRDDMAARGEALKLSPFAAIYKKIEAANALKTPSPAPHSSGSRA